ncbi:MAG: Por secretion system C-terminal sorting protein, partial [Marmoricola sp.]|nr:Por secretion system C-terminal sorting protein [Marmoricola sp.]
MIHSKKWVLWSRIALVTAIMSNFALSGFAQCLSPQTPVNFSVTGNNLTAGYTTTNVLTDNDGIILGKVVSGFPAPTVDGSYKIYTVNYSDAFTPSFTPGVNISTMGGTCVAIGVTPITFCVTGGCTLTGSSISFTASGHNTAAGYETRYVLTNNSGSIISNGTSTSITAPSTAGTYRIYVVNYNTAYGNAAPTLTAGTNISAIGGGCADTSTPVAFCIDSPLPVTLVSFSVEEEAGTAQLKWATAEETNADRFDIQRSVNTKNWSTIGEKAAAGESKALLNYSFSDVAPLNGINYYRLKMIDKDDTFAYSSIKSAKFEIMTKLLALYPNPVS